MKVVVEGKLIETREIWKIESLYGFPDYDTVGLRIGLIDKDDIEFGHKMSRGTHGDDERANQKKYDRVIERLTKIWKQDKSEYEIIEIK